jgi:hypothetical protein
MQATEQREYIANRQRTKFRLSSVCIDDRNSKGELEAVDEELNLDFEGWERLEP